MKKRFYSLITILSASVASCDLPTGVTTVYQCLDDHASSASQGKHTETPCEASFQCDEGTQDTDETGKVSSMMFLCYLCPNPDERYNKETKTCDEFVCEEGKLSCMDNQLMTCKSGKLVLHKKCPKDTNCSATGGDCIKLTCEGSKYSCIGQTLMRCSDGYLEEYKTCNENETCSARLKTCTQNTESVDCTENQYSCNAQTLKQCQDGEEVTIKECARDEVCSPESGSCQKKSCEEDEYICDGQKLIQCRQNKKIDVMTCPDGTICSSAKGSCIESECQEGSIFCKGDDLIRCENGQQNITSCGSNARCNAIEGTCDPVVTGECNAKNEGQACTGTGEPHACAQFICQNSTCTLLANPKGTLCRAAAGTCDEPEYCDGVSADCPDDQLKPAETQCRPPQHSCDTPELCDGNTAECPSLRVDNICTCPSGNSINSAIALTENSGVHAFRSSTDYKGFILKDENTWDASNKVIETLGKKYPATGLDFNREMTSSTSGNFTGFKKAYQWNGSDLKVDYWVPQGITGGSKDSIDIKVVAWNYVTGKESGFDGNKGVRVSFINTSDGTLLKYRHVLLVELTSDDSKIKIIDNNPGGLVWSWPYLYETDTSKGLRVFDLTRIIQADTSDDCKYRIGMYNNKLCAYNYAYVMPQVNFYKKDMSNSCSDYNFHYAGIERRDGSKSIMTGEYYPQKGNETTCMYSRMVRYPINTADSRLKTTNGYVEPIGGWYTGDCNIQGVSTLVNNSTEYFLLPSTRKEGSLFRSSPDGNYYKAYLSSEKTTGFMTQGIYLTDKNNAWISTSGHDQMARTVYYVNALKLLE